MPVRLSTYAALKGKIMRASYHTSTRITAFHVVCSKVHQMYHSLPVLENQRYQVKHIKKFSQACVNIYDDFNSVAFVKHMNRALTFPFTAIHRR